MATDDLLTLDEVAEILRVTPEWMYRNYRAAGIPHVKLNNKVLRFPRSRIERWIEQQVQGQPAEPEAAALQSKGRRRT